MTLVTDVSLLKSNVLPGLTYMLRAMDARLHTATWIGRGKHFWKKKKRHRTLKMGLILSRPSYLVLVCVFYNLCAQVAGFDGSQVLLVALPVAGVLVEHVWCAGFCLRFNDGVPQLLSLDHALGPALLLIPEDK